MAWYWYILIVILGLNAVAIALLGLMMVGDWVTQRRIAKGRWVPPADESSEDR